MVNYEELLKRVKLEPIPKGQIFVGKYFLRPLYSLQKLNIIFENEENLPDYPVIFVMNHTDRYNYWPFQYKLYTMRDKIKHCYTTTWVKLKYYEKKLLANFFNWTGNLPLPSKGYMMIKDLQAVFGKDKKVLSRYFRLLKEYTSNRLNLEQLENEEKFKQFIRKHNDYRKELEERFLTLMTKIYEICKDAILNKGLNLLVFPEGTRSKTLLPGKTGAVQFALSLKVPIIPVGCNGSDKAYTGNLPIVKRNKTIIYRIGKPIFLHDKFKIKEHFIPFSEKAERYKSIFTEATKLTMSKIAELLDPEYKPKDRYITNTDITKFIS